MSDPYYPWYPGDYLRDTLDLSMLEDGAYRRLLDCYFLANGNLPADPKKLYKICRAMTKSEQKAIQNVTKKYFVESNNQIHNKRADVELIKRRKFIENQRIKSKLGVQARQPVGQPVGIPTGIPGGQPLLSPSPSLKKEKTLSSNSDEYRLAEKLLTLIRDRNPSHKQPNLQTWAKEIDLMIRIDLRSPENIETLINLCQADPFWQNNILSTKKLREKFDQLWLKFKPPGDKAWQTP